MNAKAIVGAGWMALLIAGCASPAAYAELDADEPGVVVASGEAREDEFTGALSDYVDYSLRHHPLLGVQGARREAERARVGAVGRWPEPVVTYQALLRPIETKVGPQRHRITVSQSVPWPAKRAQEVKVQRGRAEVEEANYGAARLAVRTRVARLYWEMWRAKELIAWRGRQVELLETLEVAARVRVETGAGLASDLHQIGLELARLRDEIEGLKEGLRRQRARFAEALGVDSPVDLPVAPAAAPRPLQPVAGQEELLKRAGSQPALLALERGVAVRREDVRRRELERMPDLRFGLGFLETGAADDPSVVDSGKDPVVATVAVELPIWVSAYGAQVEAAQAEVAGSRARLRAARQGVVAEVRGVLSRLRDSARRITTFEASLIPQAQTTYSSVLARYEVDEGSFASVLLAQRQLLELRLSFAEAQAEHQLAWVALEGLVGGAIASEPFSRGRTPGESR